MWGWMIVDVHECLVLKVQIFHIEGMDSSHDVKKNLNH